MASNSSVMPLSSVATVRHDRRLPTIGAMRQAEHAGDFTLDAIGAGMIGLVDHENVGDLHDAGLDGLHVVTHAGDEHQHCHVRHAGDLDFVLSDAHGLDQHVIFSGGVEQKREVGGRARETSDRAARGHGADEDAGIAVMCLHADAIAQNRAAGDAAGGIDGEDAHRFSFAANGARQRIHQSALSCSGWSGNPGDNRACPACGASSREQRRGFRPCDSRWQWRRGPARACHLHDTRGNLERSRTPVRHQSFSNCRAITRRWISLVPSPMVQSFTSR